MSRGRKAATAFNTGAPKAFCLPLRPPDSNFAACYSRRRSAATTGQNDSGNRHRPFTLKYKGRGKATTTPITAINGNF